MTTANSATTTSATILEFNFECSLSAFKKMTNLTNTECRLNIWLSVCQKCSDRREVLFKPHTLILSLRDLPQSLFRQPPRTRLIHAWNDITNFKFTAISRAKITLVCVNFSFAAISTNCYQDNKARDKNSEAGVSGCKEISKCLKVAPYQSSSVMSAWSWHSCRKIVCKSVRH